MLFFIDESWQLSANRQFKVGVLSAIQLQSCNFNECSNQMFDLKVKHWGYRSATDELKGNSLLKSYWFKLEATGRKAHDLELAREVFDYIENCGVQLFASVVFAVSEIDLACANENQLERPFFFLFERIDLFMKENYPGLMAKLVFDDRGVQTNQKISKSISNFFHKSKAGKSFDTIIKVPFFAISSENVGIQIADIAAYVLGTRFTGDRKRKEFFVRMKNLQFHSKTEIDVNGIKTRLRGIKVIK